MCPHGYHYNGFMATPALGTQEVRLHIVWTALWSHQSRQTVNSEQWIVQKVNVPIGASSPNPRECSNCLGSGRNIQRITMCPHGYHHMYIHFSLACPMYYRPRVTLLNVLAHIAPLTVRTLLYGNDTFEFGENKIIIAETLRFIKESKRFDWCYIYLIYQFCCV